MAYPISETFATSIPVGFGTLIQNDLNNVSVTWNAAQQAADLVHSSTSYQHIWLISAAPYSSDFWCEFDIEFISLTAGNTTRKIGLYLNDSSDATGYVSFMYYCQDSVWYINEYAGNWGSSTIIPASGIEWRVGTRHILRIDWKASAFLPGVVSIDGTVIGYIPQKTKTNVKPGIWFGSNTLRVHSVNADNGSNNNTTAASVGANPYSSSFPSVLLGGATAGVGGHVSATKVPSNEGHYDIYARSQATGTLSGTTKVLGTASGSKKVRLYDKNTGMIVQTTWSDASGNYTFSNVLVGREYFVVSHDYYKVYNAVIQDSIVA